MNIIQNVGDLAKALSVYPQDLPVVFSIRDGDEPTLNNDTQIRHLKNFTEKGDIKSEFLQIWL